MCCNVNGCHQWPFCYMLGLVMDIMDISLVSWWCTGICNIKKMAQLAPQGFLATIRGGQWICLLNCSVFVTSKVEMCLQTQLGLSWKDLFTPHFCQSIAWITDDLTQRNQERKSGIQGRMAGFEDGIQSSSSAISLWIRMQRDARIVDMPMCQPEWIQQPPARYKGLDGEWTWNLQLSCCLQYLPSNNPLAIIDLLAIYHHYRSIWNKWLVELHQKKGSFP